MSDPIQTPRTLQPVAELDDATATRVTEAVRDYMADSMAMPNVYDDQEQNWTFGHMVTFAQRQALRMQSPPPALVEGIQRLDLLMALVEQEPPNDFTLCGMGRHSSRVTDALYRGRVEGWKEAMRRIAALLAAHGLKGSQKPV